MSILAIGGAGFIGRRLVPILNKDGHEVTVMDIDTTRAAEAFDDLENVRVIRGDVTAFDDVIGAMIETKAERVINLSYFIGELEPHVAFKLDIQGMDNCFEAARRTGVRHTVFASSVAVSGEQSKFGERLVNEDDERYGDTQYAVNKTINEWQAHDYRRNYGMTITCIRPANVTGPDKKFGSIDHVNCMCQPARGNTVTFPHADTMRCVIHVEDPRQEDLQAYAKAAEARVDLFPNSVNVELIAPITEDGSVIMRVCERGVGETEACGSGAVAVAFAAWSDGWDGQLEVQMTGGSLRLQPLPDGGLELIGEASVRRLVQDSASA